MIHYFAFETSTEKKPVEWLVESWRLAGIEGKFIGRGEKWQGVNWKLRYLRNFFNELDLPEDSIIVLTDSRDVVYAKKIDDEIIHRKDYIYSDANYKCKLLFGGESHPGDYIHNNRRYPTDIIWNKYSYLNSGTCVGVLSKIREVWNRACNILDNDLEENYKYNVPDREDLWPGCDQHYIRKAACYDLEVGIDIYRHIFHNMWDESGGKATNFDVMYDYVNRKIFSIRVGDKYENRHVPYVFHCPGSSKENGLSQVYKIVTGRY